MKNFLKLRLVIDPMYTESDSVKFFVMTSDSFEGIIIQVKVLKLKSIMFYKVGLSNPNYIFDSKESG